MKKSHIIILAAVIVLIALYLVIRNSQPVRKEKKFFTPDSAQVYKMIFESAEDTIITEKKDGVWKLTYPVNWDVNDEHLALFFKNALPVTSSTTPMSEDHKMFKTYKVDEESAIQVRLYNQFGKKLDHAYIGNGTNTAYDYGRKNGDWKTYQLKNNITNLVTPDIFQWRSPNITNLKRENMDRIEVTYLKGAYTLKVFADSIIYKDKKEQFTISQYNRAQFKVINALENLRTWQYIDKDTQQYEQRFAKPDCKIVVYLKDGKTKTFSLIVKETSVPQAVIGGPTSNVEVFMKLDDKMTPLYMMTGDFINRFTRAAMHFKSEHD